MKEIIISAKNGDSEAFGSLYESCRNAGLSVAKQYVKNDTDAEDMYQDAFLKAMENIDRFDENREFGPWLNTIIANTCKDFLGKKRPTNFTDMSDEETEFVDTIESSDVSSLPESVYVRKEMLQIVDGIVETLPLLPDGTPGKKELIDVLKEIYKILPYYADPKTGMWYQVLDRPGAEGNYVEATCSAMFTYVMLKGRRLGYLDIPEKTCKKTYKAFVKTFITREKGLVNLNRCCEVAGLGGKDNRRGDYQYYINERVRSNDPKGIGPAIWAALEMDK